MPTVIDSLVLELGLDTKGFAEGTREVESFLEKAKSVATRSGREIESQGHKITEVFTALKGGLAGLLGLMGAGAIGTFIDHVVRLDASTSRLSRSIGVSTRELSIWQGIFQQVGGSAEEASSAFGAMSSGMAAIQSGASMPSPVFAQLMARSGVGLGMGIPEMLQKFAGFADEQLKGGARPQDVRFMLQSIPGASDSLVNILMGGTKALEDMRKRAAETEALDRKTAQEAEALQKDFAALDRVARQLAEETFPAFTGVIREIVDLVKSFTGADWIKKLFGFPEGSAADKELDKLLAARNQPGGVFGFLMKQLSGTSTTFAPAGTIKPGTTTTYTSTPEVDDRIREAAVNLGLDPNDAVAMVGRRYLGKHPSTADIERDLKKDMAAGWTPNRMGIVNPPLPRARPTPGAGEGGGARTSAVNIGTINVTSNRADPKEVANAVPEAIKRMAATVPSNSALV